MAAFGVTAEELANIGRLPLVDHDVAALLGELLELCEQKAVFLVCGEGRGFLKLVKKGFDAPFDGYARWLRGLSERLRQ
jgi:hypothetical protein